MTNDLTAYNYLRRFIAPGDVIAFSGHGFISGGIKFCTHSPLSHVGVVFDANDDDGTRRVTLAESTTLNGENGVQFNYLSERLASYDGNVAWLRLSDISHDLLDIPKMRAWLREQDPCKYDYRGIAAFLTRPIPGIGQLLRHGAAQAWFCSELVVAAYAQAGLPLHTSPDYASPQWLCSCEIFTGAPEPLVGEPFQIPNFNSR